MAKIKTKVNSNLLRIQNTQPDVTSDITRSELQTQLAHKKLDKERIQVDIEEIEESIEILNT